jgi:hypothetical protein
MNCKWSIAHVGLVIFIVIVIGITSRGMVRAEDKVDDTIYVDAADVIQPNFMGVGVQWSSYPWWDVSQEDWDKIFKRVQYMRLPFVRVMLDAFWYCTGFDKNGRPTYNWNTSYMKKLCKLLDWCEENGTVVLIGEWGRPAGKDLTLNNDDPKWTRIVGDFLEYMLNEKKYTCIQYYNLVNEPHGSWSNITWDQWKKAIDNLSNELAKRGLTQRIKIASPDGDRKFTTRVLQDDQLRSQTGIYDEHWYVYAWEIENGLLELYTRDQLRQIEKIDPGKLFFLGEIGLLDDKNKNDQQLHVYDFWYGVAMADAAAQMMRGGMSGFLAWDLDDAMHYCGDGGESMNALSDVLPADAYEKRKIWGFWNSQGAEHGSPEDENLRPWYYTWSLLGRYFPPGCEIVQVEDSWIYRLRVAAARIPHGAKYHLSFAVVNNYKDKRKLKIVVPKAGQKITLARFDYFDTDADNKVDDWEKVIDNKGKDIFPGPTRVLKDVDLNSGITVELPSKGVVVLTTMEGGSSIRLR